MEDLAMASARGLATRLTFAIEAILAKEAGSASVGVCMQAVRKMASKSYLSSWAALSSTAIVDCLASMCVGSNEEIRVLAIHTMADLVRGVAMTENSLGMGLASAESCDIKARDAVMAIGKAWFKKTGEQKTTLMVLLGYTKGPLSETRHACYDLMASIVAMPSGWGLRQVFGNGETHSFLFDRRTESTKDGKEWKFSVLAAAFHCPARDRVLGGKDSPAINELRAFLQEGPFVGKQSHADVKVKGLHL